MYSTQYLCFGSCLGDTLVLQNLHRPHYPALTLHLVTYISSWGQICRRCCCCCCCWYVCSLCRHCHCCCCCCCCDLQRTDGRAGFFMRKLRWFEGHVFHPFLSNDVTSVDCTGENGPCHHSSRKPCFLLSMPAPAISYRVQYRQQPVSNTSCEGDCPALLHKVYRPQSGMQCGSSCNGIQHCISRTHHGKPYAAPNLPAVPAERHQRLV